MLKNNTLLHIQKLSTGYTSRAFGLFGKKNIKPVLNNIDLEINYGEIFGLVGESGCGKTTFGKSILGLMDYDGEIIIDGLKQGKKCRKEMSKKVQAVFQDPSSALNPSKTVGFLMEEPLKIHEIGTKSVREEKVDNMLNLVGLDPSYKSRKPYELSGGQKQRICIAISLILEPKLIIADEPISSLDVSVGAQILNLFQELHKNLGISFLFISHNIKAVYYLCNRIAVMYKGEIVEVGSAESIYNSPKHHYTKFLLSAEKEMTEAM